MIWVQYVVIDMKASSSSSTRFPKYQRDHKIKKKEKRVHIELF